MSTTYSRFYVPNKLNELKEWERRKNMESVKQKQLREDLLGPEALRNLRESAIKNGPFKLNKQAYLSRDSFGGTQKNSLKAQFSKNGEG